MTGSPLHQLEHAIQYVCKMHGLDRADYIDIQDDIRTGRLKFAFKAPKYIPEVCELADHIHRLLNDPLRGEVARTTTPALSAYAATLVDTILNPRPRIIEMDRDFFTKL